MTTETTNPQAEGEYLGHMGIFATKAGGRHPLCRHPEGYRIDLYPGRVFESLWDAHVTIHTDFPGSRCIH